MSRPKMTEAHRTQMRAQILDKAYAILIEKGPENISSRAIAKNLDLTHMGLFTYFPNQAAILKALAAREQTRLLEKMMQSLMHRTENEDIFQILEDVLRSLQDFARKNPNLFRLMWVHPEADYEKGDTSHWNQPIFDWISGLIENGIKRGVFRSRNIQLSAAAILGMVNMPFILAYSGKIPRTEMMDKMAGEALDAAMESLYKRLDEPAGKIEEQKISPVLWFDIHWASAGLPAGILLLLLSPIIIQGMGWLYFAAYLQIPLLLFQHYQHQILPRTTNQSILNSQLIIFWLAPVLTLFLAFYIWLPAGLIAIYLGVFNEISFFMSAVGFRTKSSGSRIAAVLLLALSAASVIMFTVLGNMQWTDHLLGAFSAWLLFTAYSRNIPVTFRKNTR